MKRQSLFSFRGLEKLTYLVGIPALFTYGGYMIYQKNVVEAEERALQLKKTEDKYITKNKSNMLKLQNFTKRVFAIGVIDDILGVEEEVTKQYQVDVSKNAALIRDFIKDIGAESVVLELCEERYQDELSEIVSHPNYDRTMATVHKLLN